MTIAGETRRRARRGRPRGEPRDPVGDDTERLGRMLREARERAGLGVRELATRLELSPSSVLEAERGRDLHLSTLQRYTDALPSLTPHVLLGSGPPPRPPASDAVWSFLADAFGFAVGRLRVELDLRPEGEPVTKIEMSDLRPRGRDPRSAAGRLGILHLLLRGSPAARAELAEADTSRSEGRVEIRDACFRHELSWRRGRIGYRRAQVGGEEPPPGFAPPGRPPVSAPFEQGLAFPIDLPVERLQLVARFRADELPEAGRCCAWTDLQSVAPDEPDFASTLHPDPPPVERSRRVHALRVEVRRPVFGLQYGLAWDGDPPRRTEGSPGAAAALRRSREEAGLSQRALAARLDISPVTVARLEQGHDVRRSTLRRYLSELPSLRARDLLRPSSAAGPISRTDAWEHHRALLGVEAEEERKTLVITAGGDAHAVCETLRLRRVRPDAGDLRIRYSSVQALGRRLPTQLKAIEEAIAAEAEESGLRTRVVARAHGRLIHEITVPAGAALQGASYARRLFNARFFDPDAEPSEEGGPEHDGAAIVPFHAVRRLVLTVKFPPGRFPHRVWSGVHHRTMLSGPLPEADLAERLHPEGLELTLSSRRRTLTLAVEEPLVGFIYDVFWERA